MEADKYKKSNDAELVRFFQSGKDKAAFEELYNRYKNMIYSYVRKFLYRTPEDIAREIVHEVFIKVYLELYTLRTPEVFKYWLYKIARTLCLKHIRGQKSIDVSMDSSEFMAPFLNLSDNRSDIEQNYINNEVRTLVFQELDKLDDKLKDIVMLKFFDGLTCEEISRVTLIPPRTIRFKLNRAFEKISRKLKKEGYI
ncbi:MAG: sigma-70 family RNA polymerase sigma factor [bacterium]|nr:sigma-70 family RNA polymerase sigma factor [bacterium]